MKKKTKSQFSNVLFIFCCLLVCFISLFLFFVDFNRTTVRNEKEIATIHFKRKIAQRKFSDSVVWERLQTNSFLYNEDLIRTDEDACAVMNFSNGVSLDLGEHTMIQIFQDEDNGLSLQMSGGNVVIDAKDASSNVRIDLGNGMVINLDKGSRVSANSRGGKNSVVMHEGRGTVISGGKENSIFAGDSLLADSSGVRKLPVTVLNFSAEENIIKLPDEPDTISMKLKADDRVKDKKIIVETSRDKNFTTVIERIETPPSETDAVLSSLSDELYYRVYPEGEIQNAAEGKISVRKAEVPVLISPADGSTFSGGTVTPKIAFRWTTDSYADYSRLEIYDGNDIREPVFAENVYDTTFSFEKFHEGNFLWKITPHYVGSKNGFGVPSETRRFRIEKKSLKILRRCCSLRITLAFFLMTESVRFCFRGSQILKRLNMILK